MTRGILAEKLFFTNNRAISSSVSAFRCDEGMGLALAAGLVSVLFGSVWEAVGAIDARFLL